MNESLAAPVGTTEIIPPTHEITVPEGKTLEAMFAKPAEIDKLLDRLATAARAHKPDLTTDSGRKAIASVAYKVSRSKTALDDAGKKLTEEQRRAIDAVNAERSKIRERLDSLRDEVRKPLTDWEAAEKARVEALQERVRSTFLVPAVNATAAELRKRLEEVEAVELDDSWAEYIGDAERGKLQALVVLRPALAAAEKAEADAAELEKLRAQAAKHEAAEAKRKAQEKADRERLAAEERERERLAEIEEQKRVAAEQAAERERQRAAIESQRERDAAAQREAMLKAKADAAEAEARRKLEQERQAEADAKAKREANVRLVKAAREKIAKAITAHLGSVTREAAVEIADLIIVGRVPHVRFEP